MNDILDINKIYDALDKIYTDPTPFAMKFKEDIDEYLRYKNFDIDNLNKESASKAIDLVGNIEETFNAMVEKDGSEVYGAAREVLRQISYDATLHLYQAALPEYY